MAVIAGVVSIIYPVTNLSKRKWVERTYAGEYLNERGGDILDAVYGTSDKEAYIGRIMSKLHKFMKHLII